MTGASFLPAMVVIFVVTRIRRLINRFKDSGTIGPDTAKTLEELNIRHSFLFRRLVKRNVFIEAGADRYYLEENNLEEYYRMRRIRVITVACILILLIMIDYYVIKF